MFSASRIFCRWVLSRSIIDSINWLGSRRVNSCPPYFRSSNSFTCLPLIVAKRSSVDWGSGETVHRKRVLCNRFMVPLPLGGGGSNFKWATPLTGWPQCYVTFNQRVSAHMMMPRWNLIARRFIRVAPSPFNLNTCSTNISLNQSQFRSNLTCALIRIFVYNNTSSSVFLFCSLPRKLFGG